MSASIRRFPTAAVSPPVSAPKTLSLLARLFGCRHRNLSRPLTTGGEPHRACLDCGAHRRFDTQTWEMIGPFYFDTLVRRAR